MKVFVETNFVLQIAREQEQAGACGKLLDLAGVRKLKLLIPAYSLMEVHETLTRSRIGRGDLARKIEQELSELARSTSLADRAAASREMVRLLADSVEYEAKQIDAAKRRILLTAEVLPLTGTVLDDALLWRDIFDLSPQDAVVYSTIRARLESDSSGPSCFISTNANDFADPTLRRDLTDLGCKYFASFETALAYIGHALGESI